MKNLVYIASGVVVVSAVWVITALIVKSVYP